MRPQERGENGNKARPPQGTHVLDGELTTITSNIDLPLDRYVIIIFQREGGRWCGQQSRVGRWLSVRLWDGMVAWGLPLRWACLLCSVGNDNMKNKKERGKGA